MAAPTYAAQDAPASTRALVRVARDIAGVSNTSGGDGEPLEGRLFDAGAPARVAPAAVCESGPLVRAVPGNAVAGVAAFLDGVQESRAAAWPSGVPIVIASLGAVVLKRVNGSLVLSDRGVRTRRVFLAPRDRLDDAIWQRLAANAEIEDTGADANEHHPEALLLRAVHTAETLRAEMERDLAQSWIGAHDEVLYADGGIGGLGGAARSPYVVGVVKSHRTIHVEVDSIPVLFALREGERTSVRLLDPASSRRPAVWTWYLRLRTPLPSDPFHGLVRIEVAPEAAEPTDRADDVSRWVLAERSPIALPDGRWDVMAYGIARCEAYLKHGVPLRDAVSRA
jgi:hypothetical protein